MQEEEKKYKNLSTYAVVMILTVIIIIIVAAMADDREKQFETQINETQQTNMAIQDEIVSLKDENYELKKENEKLGAAAAEKEAADQVFAALSEIWNLYIGGQTEEAKQKLEQLDASEYTEEQTAFYHAITKLVETVGAARPGASEGDTAQNQTTERNTEEDE